MRVGIIGLVLKEAARGWTYYALFLARTVRA